MGYCPSYPPCWMNNNDSASVTNLTGNAISANQSQMKIVDPDTNKLILDYETIEFELNGNTFHTLKPKGDSRKALNGYIGRTIKYILTVNEGSEQQEELEFLLTLCK